MEEDYGWGGDHVGKLEKLQYAVQVLSEGSWKTPARLNMATFALVHLRPKQFPEHLRKRATRVLGFRRKHIYEAGNANYFGEVKPNDRKEFVQDLLMLYEACLIDLGRGWPRWSSMYPTDETKKPKIPGPNPGGGI